jgi:hypothetical protein
MTHTKDTQALKLALEALEKTQSERYNLPGTAIKKAITAIEQALADRVAEPAPSPVQEPVVFFRCNGCGHAYEQVHPTSCDCMEAGGFERVEYYTTPPAAQPAPVQEPVAAKDWEGAEYWMPLAWELCADECGEEACTELVWEGGPIPEPWGERWLKYEDEAKRLIALVQKHTAPPAAPVQEPVAWRYTDARGHYRYRGYVPGFDAEYQLLKPEALCLCTTPPAAQQQWVGLTDEERNECTQSPFTADQHIAIEAKLKEKNT